MFIIRISGLGHGYEGSISIPISFRHISYSDHRWRRNSARRSNLQRSLSGTAIYTVQYAILGTNAFTLIIAVFNGVVYGLVAWIIFTIINALTKKDKKDQVNVNVVVNNNSSNPPPPPPH